jgi:hypothetical protein
MCKLFLLCPAQLQFASSDGERAEQPVTLAATKCKVVVRPADGGRGPTLGPSILRQIWRAKSVCPVAQMPRWDVYMCSFFLVLFTQKHIYRYSCTTGGLRLLGREQSYSIVAEHQAIAVCGTVNTANTYSSTDWSAWPLHTATPAICGLLFSSVSPVFLTNTCMDSKKGL